MNRATYWGGVQGNRKVDPKKEDLLVSLLTRCRDTYKEDYAAIVQSDNTAKQKLYMLSKLFEESLREGKTCVVGMLSVEFASQAEVVQNATQTSIEHSAKIFAKVFEQAADEGSFPKETSSYDAAYGFLCLLLGAQVLSRCNNDAEGFRRAVSIHIEALMGD